MSLWARLMGREEEEQVEYTVGDDGTDYDLQEGDVVDLGTGEVYYDDDDEDPNEYNEDNSDGFTGYEQISVCGVCGYQVVLDAHGDPYCGCGYVEDYDDD